MRLPALFACFFYTFTLFGQEISNETGIASFYANGFHGRLTSFGERFNIREYTAAHPTLPYNTVVKVTNLSNKKYVIVRINDRGPHTKKRILDLSPAAASEIDMIQKGVAKVTVEIVSPLANLDVDSAISPVKPAMFYDIYRYKIGQTYNCKGTPAKPTGYCIEVFSSCFPDSAAFWIDSLSKIESQDVYTRVAIENKKINYQVVWGAYETKDKASLVSDSLRKCGINGLIKKYIALKNGN